ncbi:hypothetical protein BHF71_11170 [Vulcanibacillus modesticaldus]|uniref:Nudix hydrolase domain-containing protein n=1 Tax=Vulcanibacillus modesticaldus TaxID=337097 RepID=A0A1D2YSD6_9BACI|nr:NUDIX domain-containing protein [Vulcanibacillus modesticaldus]OEF97224.1 hypothetical protein BHF71_11170 [Vulcanibacillus modesticaldus]
MERKRVQAIIIQDKKVLFGYGLINENEHRHFFIGGGIEVGESTEEAIIRELKEEANVEGRIIFKFKNDIQKNHNTFLVDIGNQKVKLGYDPEEISLKEEKKTLQGIKFLPIRDTHEFSQVDINYFKLLLSECDIRDYRPEWYEEISDLVKRKNNL